MHYIARYDFYCIGNLNGVVWRKHKNEDMRIPYNSLQYSKFFTVVFQLFLLHPSHVWSSKESIFSVNREKQDFLEEDMAQYLLQHWAWLHFVLIQTNFKPGFLFKKLFLKFQTYIYWMGELKLQRMSYKIFYKQNSFYTFWRVSSSIWKELFWFKICPSWF